MSLQIDVISDVVCPWCLIGKRHLEAALALYCEAHPDEPKPTGNWRPFELHPHLPPEGVERRDYVAQKFGGPERAAAIYQRVADAGLAAGIQFDFAKIGRQPNTRDAHRLIRYAQRAGFGDAVVEALFRSFFLEAGDLTDPRHLAAIGSQCGADASAILDYLNGDEDKEEVDEEERHARQRGVDGVPFFIFNQRYAVTGAQPAPVLLDAMLQAAGDSPL